MSMDDFGFFSEAADSSAHAGTSYSYSNASSSRAQPAPHHGSKYQEYSQYNDQHQSQQLPQVQPSYHNYHGQRQQQQQQHPHRLNTKQGRTDGPASASSVGSSSGPAKRGSNLACLKCRAIKVKCWKSNPNDPRCARCNRLDLFCEFREHHRGKKLEKVIADENRNIIFSPEMLRRARQHILKCSSYPLNVDLATMIPSPHALDASRPYSNSFTLQEYGGMAATHASSSMASSVYDDVVRMNGCSWTDACYLYNLFLTQLNPIVALLDSSLHTVQYTREQSPILFSAILDIASRFFRPDLHAQCQQAAAAVLKFASATNLCSIDHIQALIVSAIWAVPGDAARPKMLTAATTYAYELGLPFCFDAGVAVSSATKPYTPPIPLHLLHGGHQTTIARMQQRTWIQLCLLVLCADSDTKHTSAHPRTAEPIAPADLPNVRSWYQRNAATMSAYDTRLAYLFDFALAQRSFNRFVDSIPSGSAMDESELTHQIETLQLQEQECVSTWFNMYGEEFVARYAMDRYSNAEAGFLLLVYRFARAVQLYSAASRSLSQNNVRGYGQTTASSLEERWSATATELAFKVLESFIFKVLEPDSTSTSMLRFSPQYMASACLSSARWLLRDEDTSLGQSRSATVDRARERVSEVIRLLAQPHFYPDGNRVQTAGEITGQLYHALRSLMGDAAMLVPSQSSTSPKRARAKDYAMGAPYQNRRDSNGAQERNEQNRRQRRRTSSGSFVRIELGSVGSRSAGGMSESAGSDRGAGQWSPYMTGQRWNHATGGTNSGYVSGSDDTTSLSVEASLGEPHWPPSLLGVSATATPASHVGGTWTPTSEGAMSNTALTSVSPRGSGSSGLFSVSSSALPDHLNLGLGGPYGYASAQASSISTPSLPLTITTGGIIAAQPEQQGYNQARSYENSYQSSHFASHPYAQHASAGAASLQRLFSNTGSDHSNTAVASIPSPTQQQQQGFGADLTQGMQFAGEEQQNQTALPFDAAAAVGGLDASLTVDLSSSYDGRALPESRQ